MRSDVITQNYREFYEDPDVWNHFDRWHSVTRQRIGKALHRLLGTGTHLLRMANVGSGGESYGLQAENQFHVDLVIERLRARRSMLADIRSLPIVTGTIDVVVCVGSVINHVDVAVAITELIRIMRPGARIVLEFDSTDWLNHAFSATAANESATISTFYNRRTVTITEYSLRFIERLLEAGGVRVDHVLSFHILSAAALAFKIPPDAASVLAHVDWIAGCFSAIQLRGSNLVISGVRR
jgi:SAM-dependent methyltransferase